MSTYREIIGKKIKKVSSDPSSGTEGEMWYNSTTGTLRGPAIIEAWASGSPLTTGRAQAGGNGTQDSALICGGYTTAVTAVTEEYNGSGWAAGGNLTTSRSSLRSAGTQTSAIAFGGYKPSPGYITVTESYNGTSWTNSPAIGTGRTGGAQAGTSTAALYAGGGTPGVVNNSEEYNGSSWSEGDNLNTARTVVGGSGIQTAALAAGGELGPPGYTGATELYDGTSWTTSPASLNVIKGGQGQNGTQTSSLAYGGYTGTAVTGATESYNGTTWTNLSPIALATPRNATQGAGADNGSAVCFGGDPQKSETEEFNSSTNVITAGAWASGPAMGTGRYLGGYGTNTPTTAAITFGGHSTTSTSLTETFDGSSWSEQPDMNTARSRIKGFGTQTAAAVMGGRQVGTPVNNMDDTEEYNGSSWTSVTNYPSDNRGIGGAGTQTAGLAIGATDPAIANVFDYDGTNWTAAEGNLNTARGYVSGWGTQTAAGAAGGSVSPNKQYEEYNGSSWTAKGSLLVSGDNISGSGSNPSAIFASGQSQPVGQAWDGTAWATSPNRGTGSVGGIFAAGIDSTSALVSGGYVYPSTGPTTASELFTGETTALNIKTFTTS